jgi:hypothetical protein
MAATTIGAVWDRISDIVTAQGFRRAHDAFTFELQPSQDLDRQYYVVPAQSPDQTEGYLGGDQAEGYDVDIWLSRKIKRDSHGAARQLLADMDAIEAVILGDYATHAYTVTDGGVAKRLSPSEAPEQPLHSIGQLTVTVEFDRDL